MMALLNVAVYDATIAAWNAKYGYHQPHPAAADPILATALPMPPRPSYPCEYSAAAGAAAVVLAYLFPNDAGAFAEQAAAAGSARPVAGVVCPSDVAAGPASSRDNALRQANGDAWPS